MWTKDNYNGHKLVRSLTTVENTCYTRVFHSRQWSNYNLTTDRQSMTVDNTQRWHQRIDQLSMSQRLRSIGIGWYLYCFFSSWTHVHTSSVCFVSMKVQSWQTDRQTDGQTTCDSKTVLCTAVHHAVKKLQFIHNVNVYIYIYCNRNRSPSPITNALTSY